MISGEVADFVASLARDASVTERWIEAGQSAEDLVAIANYLDAGDIPGEGVFDCCGTGGDGLDTFNISTAAAFVVAADGQKVAKHGGRSTNSRSGSVDLVEVLGLPLSRTDGELRARWQGSNLAFVVSEVMLAKLGPWKKICRQIGLKGQTGLVGTLSNPVSLDYQLLGVPFARWLPLMSEALAKLGRRRAAVVLGSPGLDEVSVCGPTRMVLLEGQSHLEMEISPEELGLSRWQVADLLGGDPETNAELLKSCLRGEGPPALMDAIAANAGVGLWLCGRVASPKAGVDRARELTKLGIEVR